MRRFFQSRPPDPEGRLLLEDAEAVHATKVLRLKPGDAVTVLDGCGGEYQCRVEAVLRREMRLTVDRKVSHPAPVTDIVLCQALVKGKAFEQILQKSVELGATSIVPVITERSVVQLNEAVSTGKVAKWRQVAIEAIKQCGAAWLPRISEPATLDSLLQNPPSDGVDWVASLEDGAVHPRKALPGGVDSSAARPRSVRVWIGPEGDFSPTEYRRLKAAGATPVRFGGRVLRSETAAAYALAVLDHELNASR